MSSIAFRTILILPAFILGCAFNPSLQSRYTASDGFSFSHGFKKSCIKAGNFTLTTYVRLKQKNGFIHIYIEGDGVSWVSREHLSKDPTPYEPMVLELASMDPVANVAYLARPGQYGLAGHPDCDSAYWSNKRFSEEVIASMNEAVSQLAMQAEAQHIELIGYSGGAAVAVLIAARRHDIAGLITIAGNLDPNAVNKIHHVSPLQGSLDPMTVAEKIRDIPQSHFVGAQDKTVPLAIARAFVHKEGIKDYKSIIVVADVSHAQGWRENWKALNGF